MAFYSPDYFKNPIELNRPISEEEKATHMPQQDRLWDFDETRPHYELSVIRQNSTFVEIVDRNYPVRGIGSLMTIVGMGLTGFMFSWIGSISNFVFKAYHARKENVCQENQKPSR